MVPEEKFAVHGMVKLDTAWATSTKHVGEVDLKLLDDLIGNSYNLHCTNAIVISMLCHFPWMLAQD